jgi:hypothetical protein
MIKGDAQRSKNQLGDIGEFLIILGASNYSLDSKLIELVLREYLARQVFWVKNMPSYLIKV